MRIGLVYNARPTAYDRNDPALEKYIEGDEWKTTEATGKAVIGNGHTVQYFAIDENIYDLTGSPEEVHTWGHDGKT